MQRLEVVGLNAFVSNQNRLVATVYVDGNHPDICQIPIGEEGITHTLGYTDYQLSELSRRHETVWRWHADPQDGLDILTNFATDNIASPEAKKALDETARQVAQRLNGIVTQVRPVTKPHRMRQGVQRRNPGWQIIEGTGPIQTTKPDAVAQIA